MLQSQAHVGATGRAAFWRFYMGAWVVLASASLAYLGLFAVSPEAQHRVMARVETELLGTTRAPAPPRTATAALPPATEGPAADNSPPPRTIATRTADDAGQPQPTAAAPSQSIKALEDELASLRTRLARAQEPPAGVEAPLHGASLPQPGDPGSHTLQPSSPFTTASIPRTSAPDALPAARATSPPNDAGPASPDTAPLRAPDTQQPSASDLAAPNPAIVQPAILNKAPEPRSEPPAEPRTTRPPGRNLAIIPLRGGRLPPLPQPDRSRPPSPQPVAAQPGQLTRYAAPSGYSPSAYPSSGYGIPGGTQPPSFGTATVITAAVPTGAAALALSTAPSVTGLRASWLLLSSRHGATLAGYQPRYVFDPLTATYRLLAGPFTDRAEADRICGVLIADDIRCGVTQFTGEPL